ncbi:MAG: OmpP1/FadL family transporter [Prevotella sp.]
MKKILLFSVSLFSSALYAQDTYNNALLSTSILNGTARYVGMGGAMDALGADLSVISTNPAGIGLYRSSQAKLTFGMVSQQDAPSGVGGNSTYPTFDQAGFVYSIRNNSNSFVNIAFNYHRESDFNFMMRAEGDLNNASQNGLSYSKSKNHLINPVYYSRDNVIMDDYSNMFNQLDYLYYNSFLWEGTFETRADGVTVDYDAPHYSYNFGKSYTTQTKTDGYIGAYDFNISGNINNQIFLGLTVGIRDVHYNNSTIYTENVINKENIDQGQIDMINDLSITGTGYNVKAGVIVRPVETSPLRFGISVSTPTWYDLKSSNTLFFRNRTACGVTNMPVKASDNFDFKFYTPWQFGFSAGTSVEDYLALGVTYEYEDYSSINTRIVTGGYYSDFGDYYEDTSPDREMNRHTKNTLKGVHTVKLGTEYRPDPSLAIRFGYNFVSPMYKETGARNEDVDSPYSYYASATDYINWKETNRITCGIGYVWNKLTLDVAYQYSSQKGIYHPMVDYVIDGETFTPNTATVKNDRHYLQMTVGYQF